MKTIGKRKNTIGAKYRLAREKHRVRRELDLKTFYPDIEEEMNIHAYFMNRLKEYPPKLEFTAKTKDEYFAWKTQVIDTVKKLIHYEMEWCPLEVEKGPSTIYEGIELTKYYFSTSPGLKCPAILAKPLSIKKPSPAIICLHGHNFGKINTIGMAKSKTDAYFGLELAQRGYVTLSLDQWGWGERKGVSPSEERAKLEKVFDKTALLFGMTAAGIRSWEVSRAIDFLQTLDFVSENIGIIGHSGGGLTTSYACILDDRITAAVISGYFCSWLNSIFSLDHCICNHIPGIMKYVDLPDLVAARAPKPTFIIAGERDEIFLLEGVKNGYKKLEKAFELFNKGENVGIDIYKGAGHMFRGLHAYPWLDKFLKKLEKTE